jgi:acyl carrier protein
MIDVCILSTPIAEAIVEEEWPSRMTLRSLLTAGDKLHAGPGGSIPFHLYNNYGPTESTVIATWAHVPPDGGRRAPSIGRPVDNTRVYVLDPRGGPVPIGVSGELYIGGEAIARGYLDRPAFTAERFLPDPFAAIPGDRMYRTGDLVRFLRGGDIEFLGRIDNQVKIRGYRIELGEIEVALAAHSAVREAAVTLHEDVSGEKRLVAYVVPREGATPADGGLKAFLRDRLPGYMVPSSLLVLEELPLTPNGKVDRRALPPPPSPRPERGEGFEAPRSDAERAIAGIWRDVLRLDRIGVHDNFFDLGGHSMLLVQAHSRLQKRFGTEISIIDMFKYPTVSSLAVYIRRGDTERSSLPESGERGRARRASLRRRRLKRARGAAG